MTPALGIIQARLHSSRLPKKMLLDLGGHPVVWWSWDAAVRQFGPNHTVVAVPVRELDTFHEALPKAHLWGWAGSVHDVLGRLAKCANFYRVDPQAMIYRITPDDWPPVLFRDRITLKRLNELNDTVTNPHEREHVGTLFQSMQYELNTADDLAKVREELTT